MKRCFRLAVVVIALLPAAAFSQDAVPRQFFDEETFLAVQVKTKSFSIERVWESFAAVVPADSTARAKSMEKPPGSLIALSVLREMTTRPEMLDQLRRSRSSQPLVMVENAAKALAATGVDRVTLLLRSTDKSAVSGIVLTKLAADDATRRKQLDGFRAFVEVARATVVEAGGWAVAHTGDGLPAAADEFSVIDSVFADGIRSGADDDVVAVFVPTPRIRTTVDETMKFMAKSAKAGEGRYVAAMNDLRVWFSADWHRFTIRFGDDPRLRMVMHFDGAARAKSMVTAWTNAMGIIRKLPSTADNARASRDIESAVTFLNLISVSSDEDNAVIDLTRTAMQKGLQKVVREARDQAEDE